ncbi:MULTISPECIES: hypothetical protein [Acinetobacter calcoaceticus/baumannii complex]|uniref:Bacteriophage coat protein B n=1 Tax=Acinetobacter baumannii EGD-HP18 TaxID=1358412 RepID=A0AAV3JY73_ACIBA|nr:MULTISPECIES: hypothetical protein [Acinetobacter calcoaceticus/baumannii complex]ERH68332.1 hypothetical protein N173_19515 [Acinetobacter baumannii EGD-HP18]MCX3054547.1 hypothetical protein [Acinetobacter baumannii]MDC4145156.1 hypothetical protein [Acinetobacter baumannii]MDO7443221.1 hypothetical protein [Acinetobacter baumannii]MDV7519047.1 hypothetical protein [Acinetobacter baumannii]
MNKKFGLVKKAGVAVAAAGSAIAANAATITYDTTGILSNIDASEAFAITCGLAFIALTATISVLRKGRGAVR